MENLVRQARDGDADAFMALIRLQKQNLYRTSRAILSNEEDAADAISETILTCWEKIKELKKDKYFYTWMTRILINKCRDILRKKEKLLLTEQLPEIGITDEGYQNVEWIEVLQLLEEKYRLIVVLYYVDGFRTTEISKILEMPVSTVCTRLAKARKILADSCCLQPEQKADHTAQTMKEKGKERFAVKRRKNNNIKILRQEAPIPEIVEQKIENAFLAIKNGEVSCGSESMTAHSCKKPVRKWSFASVAAFVVCAATACAASYTNWSQSLEKGLRITQDQKQMLEESHAWSVLDQSVKSEGVTVTARQCILDSYCAYITFKIEGYNLPEGASPVIKRMNVVVGDYDPRGVYYYADFYRDSRNDWKEDGILLADADPGGSYRMEDGSLEYQMRILTMKKGALSGRPIHITLQGLGSRMGEEWPVYDNTGSWEFEWVLHGTTDTAQTVLYEKIGNTGATIIKAELSPISVRYTFDRGSSGIWPMLFGFRTKDGKLHLNTAGARMSRFDGHSNVRCTIIHVSRRILDAEQIDALVFTDVNYKFKMEDMDKHLYMVPIEGYDFDP